jgi:primosomal protein N' (replication factor Y)
LEVATTKPLRLKRQRSSNPVQRFDVGDVAGIQAEVLLDLGIYHIEQSFSYFVPAELSSQIQVGSVVQVPFREIMRTGLVTELGPITKANLAAVSKLRVTNCLTQIQLSLAKKIADRYIANWGQITDLFFPSFTKEFSIINTPSADEVRAGKPERSFLELDAGASLHSYLINILKENNFERGSLLILFPTERKLTAFKSALNQEFAGNFVEYGSHLTPAARRDAFRRILLERGLIVAGLRGAVFAPIPDLSKIIMLDENSVNYIEQRAPYWNSREIALLRSEMEGCDLLFIAPTCSAEIWRLLQLGWIKKTQIKSKRSSSQLIIQTLPVDYLATIRESLNLGPVLISVATKDYAAGFVCAKCRNRARCNCGSPLAMTGRGQVECGICGYSNKDWCCIECNSKDFLIFRSGARKVREEIGKAFPRSRLLISTSDSQVDQVSEKNIIVVATYGAEPIALNGYAGLVLLDGEEMISRRFVRAEEELFHLWKRTILQSAEKARVFLSLNANHPICQAIISNKSSRFLEYTMQDRQNVAMPPAVRLIQIEGESRSLAALRSKLVQEFGAKIDILASRSLTFLTIKIQQESAPEILKSIKALQKLRSASGKDLFKIKVDPYYF